MTFDFVMLTTSRQCPRPAARWDLHEDTARNLPARISGFGWAVPHKVDHRLAPPESALALMEAGAGLPEQAERLRELAAEFRAAIAAGKEQADEPRDEKQVRAFLGAHMAQAWEGD